MRRILFVDDEPSMLDGLKNLLRKQRREWDIAFASGGASGLEELAKAPFDVVVSDMRMPQMDGVVFLGTVRSQYPGTTRIILSGQADQERVVKALPVSHQYLSKPCDAETLKAVIGRACDLRDLVTDATMRDLVGGLGTLPPAPSICRELAFALTDPRVTAVEAGGIIERDPALCSKILQIVNSAYFGSRQSVTSVKRAVSYLGLELIKALACTNQMFSADDRLPLTAGRSVEALRQRALMVAEVARQIVRDPGQREIAFTAGLLHDVGSIVLAIRADDRIRELHRLAATLPHRPFYSVEQELLGVSHAELGAFLLGTWGLPARLVAAVARHHTPATASPEDVDLTIAVHVADALVSEGMGVTDQPGCLDLEALAAFGVTGELAGWQRVAERITSPTRTNAEAHAGGPRESCVGE